MRVEERALHQQQTASDNPSFLGVSGTHSSFLRASILAIVLVAGGCASTPPEAPVARVETPAIVATEPVRPAEPPVVTTGPAAEVAALPPATGRVPSSSAARPVQPRPPVLQPESLIGLNRDETVAALGTPEFMQERPPATVWAYRTGDCVLEIFFYVNVATRESRALATNVVAPADTEAGRRNCAQRILAERHVRR